jgi:putative DNA primase/helicase
MSFYKAETVRAAASGNWLLIVSALARHAEDALKKPGRHVPCPIHGGKDGFRVFKKNFLETGGGVCNTCGPRHDGFELLMWLNNWNFKETLSAVGELLGVEKERSRREQQQQYRHNQQSHKVTACGTGGTVPAQAETASPGSVQEESKVIPMLREQSKPWLLEVQEDLERKAESQRAYSAKLHEKIGKVWEQCVPLSNEVTGPLRAYLRNRQLLFKWKPVEESDCLRFHPALPYYDEDANEVGKFPALVCAIRDKDGQLITLHRIYLTPTGKKARVPEPKKMMPVPDDLTVTGAAIRLGEPTEGILGLAEGVETALSAFRATHIPVWATVNANLMESFEVPEGVHTVVIWADKDKSLTGEKSANVLKERLVRMGLQVIVLVPKLPIPSRAKGLDWNDVLISQGILGFPGAKYLRDFIYGRYANAGRL